MTQEEIEKAADEYVNEACRPLWRTGNEQVCKVDFMQGANWRINSIWHDISESPKPDKLIYILRKDGIIKQIYTYDGVDELFNTLMVYKWAYIEDLIPNMEE